MSGKKMSPIERLLADHDADGTIVPPAKISGKGFQERMHEATKEGRAKHQRAAMGSAIAAQNKHSD